MAIGSMTTNSTVDLIDKTLKTENAPADAKAVGDIILDRTKETPQPIFYSKAAVDEMLAKKLDLTGGDMQGWIDFGNQLRGLKWTVGNGDYYTVVNEPNSNLFQIVRQPHNGTIYAPLNITENGQIIMYTGGSGWFTIDDQQVETVAASGGGYVRLGDGTQICWGAVQLSSSITARNTTTLAFTFPVAFADAFYIKTISQRNDPGGSWNVSVVNTDMRTTGFDALIVNGDTTTVLNAGAVFEYIAIGRWK